MFSLSSNPSNEELLAARNIHMNAAAAARAEAHASGERFAAYTERKPATSRTSRLASAFRLRPTDR